MEMMFSNEQTQSPAPFCLLCYGMEKLSRCSRCGSAYYCSRDHQVQHWKVHRKHCKPSLKQVQPTKSTVTSSTNAVPHSNNEITSLPIEHVVAPQFVQEIQQPTYSTWVSNNVVENSTVTTEVVYPSTQVTNDIYTGSECMVSPETLQAAAALYESNETTNLDTIYAAVSGLEDKMFMGDNHDVFSSLSSELLSSANNYWDIINNCNTENFTLNYNLDAPNTKRTESERVIQPSLDDLNFLPVPPSPGVESANCQTVNNNEADDDLPLEDVCLNIINDLNEYGICVIDKFLGSKLGDLIASEVKSLFYKGIFKKGEVVSSTSWRSNENIRGDVITWVDGTESGCYYIGSLIKRLDFVMTTCNKLPDNGILNKYKLNRRTKAMIACYPGDGTHYKKHIDNPNGDGRCITCIYYLNRKWDTKTDGGLLRMFPVGHENEVANIEPIFDRMLFFWSDKRNPHEVLPSNAIRFAITVWYFDSDERDKALQTCRAQMQKS